MKPFIIALTLYLFVNISSCSTNDAPIVEPPNGETAEDSNTPTMNEQIRIIIGNASFTATFGGYWWLAHFSRFCHLQIIDIQQYYEAMYRDTNP